MKDMNLEPRLTADNVNDPLREYQQVDQLRDHNMTLEVVQGHDQRNQIWGLT